MTDKDGPRALAGRIAGEAGQSDAASRGAERTPFFCGDIDMRIARDGTWYYQGTPIGRRELVKLFSTVLCRDEQGDFWLETPVEKCRIEVEDAPFIVTAMEVTGEGRDQSVRFTTNIDSDVVVDEAHPLKIAHRPDTGDPAPYVTLRPGIDALLGRAVYYELVEHGVEEHIEGEDRFGIWSKGGFFALGSLTTDS